MVIRSEESSSRLRIRSRENGAFMRSVALMISVVVLLSVVLSVRSLPASPLCEPCDRPCPASQDLGVNPDLTQLPPSAPPPPQLHLKLFLDRSFSMIEHPIGVEEANNPCVGISGDSIRDYCIYDKRHQHYDKLQKKSDCNHCVECRNAEKRFIQCEEYRKKRWVDAAKNVTKQILDVYSDRNRHVALDLKIYFMFNNIIDPKKKASRKNITLLKEYHPSNDNNESFEKMIGKLIDNSKNDFRNGSDSRIKEVLRKQSLDENDIIVMFTDGKDYSFDQIQETRLKKIQANYESIVNASSQFRPDLSTDLNNIKKQISCAGIMAMVLPSIDTTDQGFSIEECGNSTGKRNFSVHQVNQSEYLELFLNTVITAKILVYQLQKSAWEEKYRPHDIVNRSLPSPAKPTCQTAEGSNDLFSDVVAVGRATSWHCTGVAVSPRLVLTARHCLPATHVLAGPDVRQGGPVGRVVETYLPLDESLDAALLRLDQPLAVRLHVRRRDSDSMAPVGVARLIGFGAIDPQGSYGFGRKHHTDLPISGWGCDDSRSAALGCSPGSELAIPASGGRDTCDGDSGGPVFELVRVARPCCPWRLVGITSRPLATSSSRCGGGGVYIRADRLDGWISKTIRQVEPSAQ